MMRAVVFNVKYISPFFHIGTEVIKSIITAQKNANNMQN